MNNKRDGFLNQDILSNAKNMFTNNKSQVSEAVQEKMMETLGWAYDKTINGVPGQESIDDLVNDYLSKNDKETAIDKLVQFQVAKAATSGFVTGFGGVITFPVTIPANIASVILFQMRMIAAIARIRGYDLKSDQVQTFVYATLAGTSVSDIVKKTGILFTNKLATGMISRIPGKALISINQRVGFRLATKFGSKGLINLGKMVPVLGAVVGGAFDTTSTLAIASLAKKTFLEDGVAVGDGTVIDKKILEVVPEENN
ncbi:EcsC family protein [Liquorilactobacillus hordei]|uniref:EcsC family protein n=1 Tax=Liquorilactobacillus hordei TaxID=468911 RepID=UPI0039EB02BF